MILEMYTYSSNEIQLIFSGYSRHRSRRRSSTSRPDRKALAEKAIQVKHSQEWTCGAAYESEEEGR